MRVGSITIDETEWWEITESDFDELERLGVPMAAREQIVRPSAPRQPAFGLSCRCHQRGRLINVYHQVTATELVKRPFPGAIIADIPGSPPRPASCAFS
jgi:hypothetical protein